MWELGRVEAKSYGAAVAEVLTCHDVTLHPEKKKHNSAPILLGWSYRLMKNWKEAVTDKYQEIWEDDHEVR